MKYVWIFKNLEKNLDPLGMFFINKFDPVTSVPKIYQHLHIVYNKNCNISSMEIKTLLEQVVCIFAPLLSFPRHKMSCLHSVFISPSF